MRYMKDMIVENISDNGEVTLSVERYDPTKCGINTITFATSGFAGWLIKTYNGNTTVNFQAPARLLAEVYKMITW